MYNKSDFQIAGIGYRWYIALKDAEESTYLLKDGKVRMWYKEACIIYPDTVKREKLVYFSSKEEAEQFLDNYLRGQNMSTYDDRLAQCDKDIAALQAEKVKIVKEKEAAEVKKFYLGTEFVTGTGNRYLLVRIIHGKTNSSRGSDYLVGLVKLTTDLKGFDWKGTATLEVKQDNIGYYVTKLPTSYPGDFDLAQKYGV